MDDGNLKICLTALLVIVPVASFFLGIPRVGLAYRLHYLLVMGLVRCIRATFEPTGKRGTFFFFTPVKVLLLELVITFPFCSGLAFPNKFTARSFC